MANSKYHIRESGAGGCARAATGLSVSWQDFKKLLPSDKCKVCLRRSTGPADRVRFRATNAAGETLGVVIGYDAEDALHVARIKYGKVANVSNGADNDHRSE